GRKRGQIEEERIGRRNSGRKRSQRDVLGRLKRMRFRQTEAEEKRGFKDIWSR
ncbi:unnamed protein product, partial [Citrullus colocynthis]